MILVKSVTTVTTVNPHFSSAVFGPALWASPVRTTEFQAYTRPTESEPAF